MSLKVITLKLSNKLNCGVGDQVSLVVTTVSKLTSSGTTSPSSDVPAIITSIAMNTDGTYCYTFSYDTSVLLNSCNYLVSQDISSVKCGVAGSCCANPCNSCSCVQSSCIPNVNSCGS